jgi:hypothetical protein
MKITWTPDQEALDLLTWASECNNADFPKRQFTPEQMLQNQIDGYLDELKRRKETGEMHV